MKVKRAELENTMNKRYIWALAYGSSIGWGAFILPGDWLASSGTMGAVLGIVIGGLLMALIGVSYGALTAKFPVSGGEFAFTYVGFGRYISFIASWFLILGYIAVVALNASAFSLLFKFVLPDFVEVGYLYTLAGWDVYIVEVILSTLVLIVFAIISIRGGGFSGNLQFIFSLIMAIIVTGLFLLSFTAGDFALENIQPVFNAETGMFASILIIIAIAPWMFVGFDNIPQAAEEFKFEANKTMRLIIFSIIAATLTYVAMILITSWTFMDQESIGGALWVTGSVVQTAFGGLGLFALAVAISMGVFTGLNGFYISSSRLMFALGRAKFIPTMFGQLHKKFNTPYVAVIFVAIICLVAPWLGRTALVWIVDMSATGVSIAFLVTCLVTAKLFSVRENYNLTYVIFGWLGAIVSLVFLGLLLLPFSPAALSIPSYIALAVWTVLGLIFFAIQFKQLRSLPKEEMDYLILNINDNDKIK